MREGLVGRDEGELSGKIFEPNTKDEWAIGELNEAGPKKATKMRSDCDTL